MWLDFEKSKQNIFNLNAPDVKKDFNISEIVIKKLILAIVGVVKAKSDLDVREEASGEKFDDIVYDSNAYFVVFEHRVRDPRANKDEHISSEKDVDLEEVEKVKTRIASKPEQNSKTVSERD